ncbi:MAG: hypothetical protein ACP5E4_04625 [Candidatus Aenigmatarchaeota archaeon]
MDELEMLKLELDSRGFSPKTKKVCLFFAKDFLGFSKKGIGETTGQDIKLYIARQNTATTQVYPRISSASLRNIRSPADDI